MNKKMALILTTAAVMRLAGCSGQTDKTETTAAPAKTTAEPATQAKAETTEASTEAEKKDVSGKITLYTSQPEEDAQKLIDGFNKECPDVTVDVFRSGTEEVVSKVLAEQTAGAVQADVLLVADSVTFETLKEQDMLLPYESPELKGIPEEYIDKDHMYTGTKVITTGIAYNTDLVKDAPKGFADLTGEAFKDAVIMPSPLYSGAAAYNLGVLSRNETLGWDFFQGLKDNGITVDKGNGAIQKAVVAGEKSCGILVDYMANRSKNDGAPVEFVYPEEGSPAITEPIGVLKDSRNQEAAEAFVDFVLSDEGQELAASIGYTPVKEGVAAPEGLKSIDQIKTISADTKELYSSRDADKEKFSEIFQ